MSTGVLLALAVPSHISSLLWATLFLSSSSFFRYSSVGTRSLLSSLLESLELLIRSSFLLGSSEDPSANAGIGGPEDSESDAAVAAAAGLFCSFLSAFSSSFSLLDVSELLVETIYKGPEQVLLSKA